MADQDKRPETEGKAPTDAPVATPPSAPAEAEPATIAPDVASVAPEAAEAAREGTDPAAPVTAESPPVPVPAKPPATPAAAPPRRPPVPRVNAQAILTGADQTLAVIGWTAIVLGATLLGGALIWHLQFSPFSQPGARPDQDRLVMLTIDLLRWGLISIAVLL